MEQVTTNVVRQTATRWMVAALMLALATALVVYPTSPALAQEEAQPPSDQVTLSFELTVKGEVPEGTNLLGFIPAEGGIRVPLSDSDGDGVYTGSTTLDRFGPGPRPVPPGTEPVSLPVQIARESGGNIEVIRDFGVVPLNGDRTFSARVNFKRDGRDTEVPEDTAPGTPDGGSEDGGSQDSGSGASGEAPDLTAPENGVDLNQDGSADEADGQVAAATSDAAMEAHQASGGNALPATGGAAILQIAGSAGALLVAGGLLIRRLTR
ncbi:MAG: hypothetical protein M3N45_02185 [Actinomycetota bacterium]|nr:hypothetical protein [Actinomycetota bacterium]